MITILKETPITFNSVDCMEVLVKDDAIDYGICCDLCIYDDKEFDSYHMCSCMDIHGCTCAPNTYFITKPL